MSRYRVAVSRADKDHIAAGVERAVNMLGGMERFVRRGDRVLIKVNLFTYNTPESGFTTHPEVIIATARLCHELGAHPVVVERTPNLERNLAPFPEIRKYAEVVCLDQAPHTARNLPGARSLRDEVDWADLIDDADVFINIPGLRTHALSRFSNGMKNLMGLLPRHSTFRVHMYGLEGSIVDLNAARPSDLVITDAVYTLHGNFPSQGKGIYTGFVTAADNVVAADLFGARVFGIDPSETQYLPLAHKRGLGPASLDEVEVLGDDIGEILKGITFEQAGSEGDLLNDLVYRYNIHAENACQSCRQALAGGIIAAEAKAPGLLEMFPDLTFVCGPEPEDFQVESENVLYFGNCVYRYNQTKGTHIPGCPPLSGYVMRGLLEMEPHRPHTSICSIAWRAAPLREIIPLVAQAGYEGIELWGPHVQRYLDEGGTLAQLKALLAESGLAVPMISPYMDLAEDQEASLALAERVVGWAVALGAPLVRVFVKGGPSAQASHETWAKVVAGLKALCRIGAPHKIAFALETHQNNLHDTSTATLRLIRQVGAENLGVNLDIHNLFDMGEDPVLAARRLMPFTRIMHLKNGHVVEGKLKYGVPLPEGNMDYAPFMAEVRKLNYGGYASIEWFGDDPAGAARSELAYLGEQWALSPEAAKA
ncbi:MAG: DUF362 domain-containing protein [Chloroflexi bacterium]|nr:DUF362 domain-containing protein [Chloroflexota bacterium]